MAIKAAATVALIALLVERTDMSAVGRVLGGIDTIWISVLVALMLGFGVASAARWYRVLCRLDEPVSFRAILADTFAGMAYNMLLPTTVGGDVIRALRCAGRVSRTHRAWSSVLYERVAGVLAMALAGAIAIAVVPSAQLGPLRWVALGAAVLLTVLFVRLSAPFRLLLAILRRNLSGSPEFVEGLARDLDDHLARRGPRVEVMAWSVLCVGLGYAYSIASALSLDAPDAIIPLVLGLPVIFVVSMVPITISGLGVREGLFVVVLGQFGVDGAVAMAIALQALAGLLFAAAVGLLVLVAERRPPGPGTAELD